MFYRHSESDFLAALPGIERKTLVHGDKTLLVEFRLRRGFPLPRHAHPHEQTGYLVSGCIRLPIGDEVRELRSGDAWCISSGVEHSAEVIEDSVAIEIFSPVREDYLSRS